MATDQGSATPKQRRRKVSSATTEPVIKKVKGKRWEKFSSAVEEDGQDEQEQEDVNPGMLLRDFIEEPVATGRKAARSALRSGKAGKVTKKKRLERPTADSSDDGEGDLLAFGQGSTLEQGEEAGASAKLLGAIDKAGASRSAAAMRPRHAEEALPENQFHSGAAGDEISVEDLLAPLAESTGFGDVKKLLQGMSKKEAMPEPQNEVKQGREERFTRYKDSSRDIQKFLPQVQRMKKADQVTLGEVSDLRPGGTAALVGNFRPTDDFEKELEMVTKAAGATEEDMIDTKGLPMNTRIRNEQQTQQVARLKALMLRQQQAHKRIKKIKSKAYHRVARKSENREREVLLERLERENPELAKSLRQDFEKKHAERRLQRQRNARKKWAQTMQRFAKGDEGAQKEITKQAQAARDESVSLRRVIQGRDADQSDDSEAMDLSDSEDEGGPGSKARTKQRTIDKAKKLTLEELDDLKKGGELPTTGLLGLGFMRNAINEKRKAAKSDAQSVLNELEGLGARLECEDAADSDDETGNKLDTKMAKKNKAAQSRPVAEPPKKREFTEEELEKASKEVDAMLEQDDATQSVGMSVSGPLTVRGVEAQKVPLQGSRSSTSSSSAAPAVVTHTDAPAGASRSQASSAGSSGAKAQGEKKPLLENPWLAEPAADAATPSASSAPVAEEKKAKTRRGAAASAAAGIKKRKRRRSMEEPEADGASEGEGEEDGKPKVSASELLNVLDADAEDARQQRDLVRATFVEGTQAEDFDNEKDEKLKEQEEKDRPSEMLGWGSWTGAGMKPREPRKPDSKGKGKGKGKGKAKGSTSGVLQKHDTPKPPHVQHYEGDSAVKAQAKYFVDQVPYPFKSPAQYDQEMRMPSGPEWNTLAGHLQRVKPKLFMKVGTVVPPLQYVKHLPQEQQEGAMNAWAGPKQPKRLKARF